MMDQRATDTQENLRHKFPNLQPVKRAPWLGAVSGCGLRLFGKRDWDADTSTCVKTRCLCVLNVPLLALGAYRVGDAGEDTWFFFGKTPLSLVARLWNAISLSLAVVGSLSLSWNLYVSSPSHQARLELSRAAQLMASQQPAKAAIIYRKLLVDGFPYPEESRAGLQSSVEKCLQSDAPEIVHAGMRIIAGLPAQVNQPTPLFPDAVERGLTLVTKFRPKDPEAALQLLDEMAPIQPKMETTAALRNELLRESVAAHPDNTNRVIELACHYEEAQQLEESVRILLPVQHQLGSTEGARILGQYLLKEGKNAEAYPLLFPYVQARLATLHEVEREYTNTLDRAYQNAFDDLNHHRAGRAFYEAYAKASKSEQDVLVDAYIKKEVQDDPDLKRVLVKLAAAGKIVPVTLDLGIVQVNRAQELKDPAARKTELEAAEKTFLAIRGLAGETDEYRMFLGQVYYWLGKSKEGKELFDQLLAAKKRSYAILMSLAHTLRDVGEMDEARALLEEAYATAGGIKAEKQKFAAAAARALVQKDPDDEIAWLEKADPSQPDVQISLNGARGEKALEQGNKDAAAQYLRKAIGGYENLPRSAPTLNNWGLACFNLYEATGDIADHNRGLALLEEAISLDPGNSVLLINTLQILLSRAVMDVVGDAIQVQLLHEPATMALLPHLYEDEAGRKAVYLKLHKTESMQKTLAYLDKALLLAPKNAGLYELGLHLYNGFEDLPQLQKLQQRFAIAELDLSNDRADALQVYRGDKDKEYLDKFQIHIRRLEGWLQTPAVRDHPLTFENVSVSLTSLRQSAWLYGGEVNSQKLLDEAEAAQSRHSSAATESALISAFFFRASDELSQQNQSYADLAAHSRRSLSAFDLIAYVLERGGPMADTVGKNPNVQRAAALVRKQRVDRFPSFPNIEDWAFFRRTDPSTAAAISERLKSNALAQLAEDLTYQLGPMSAQTVLAKFWMFRMLGDEKKAAETFDAALRRGVPLPPKS